MSAVAIQKKDRTAGIYKPKRSAETSLAGAQGKKLWFGGAALKQLILQMQRKPERGAPASGPLDCHWGCDHVTAWRGTGGLPA